MVRAFGVFLLPFHFGGIGGSILPDKHIEEAGKPSQECPQRLQLCEEDSVRIAQAAFGRPITCFRTGAPPRVLSLTLMKVRTPRSGVGEARSGLGIVYPSSAKNTGIKNLFGKMANGNTLADMSHKDGDGFSGFGPPLFFLYLMVCVNVVIWCVGGLWNG